MAKHALFPFHYEFEGGNYRKLQYFHIKFTDDYGPIKKDTTFDVVEIDFDKGILSTWWRVDPDDSTRGPIEANRVLFSCPVVGVIMADDTVLEWRP